MDKKYKSILDKDDAVELVVPQEIKPEPPKTKIIELSKDDINIIVTILNVVGNGKHNDIIQKLRG